MVWLLPEHGRAADDRDASAAPEGRRASQPSSWPLPAPAEADDIHGTDVEADRDEGAPKRGWRSRSMAPGSGSTSRDRRSSSRVARWSSGPRWSWSTAGPGSFDHSYFSRGWPGSRSGCRSSTSTSAATAVRRGAMPRPGPSKPAPTTSGRSGCARARSPDRARPFDGRLHRHPLRVAPSSATRLGSSCSARSPALISTDWSRGFWREAGDEAAALARRDYSGEEITDDEGERVFAAFGPRVPSNEELARRIKNSSRSTAAAGGS